MNGLQKTLIAASCLVLSVATVQSQTVPKKPTNVTAAAAVTTSARPMSDTANPAGDHRTIPPATRVIVVSLEDRRLALMEDGAVKKVYRVAVGRETTPSPTGAFTIVDRVENPTYYHEGQVIPPGPGNPVGTRWIGLDRKGYGIHGTNMPHSLGKAASHGCIRMGRRDLEDLFAQVRSGDAVEIIGERNDETAAIFGEPASPVRMQSPARTLTARMTQETPAQTTPVEVTATVVVPAGLPANR